MKKAILSLAIEVLLVAKASAQLCTLYTFKNSRTEKSNTLISLLVSPFTYTTIRIATFDINDRGETASISKVFRANQEVCGIPTTIVVSNPPTITSQPQSVSGCLAGNYTFSVGASPAHGGVLHYQWRKNGIAITGATSASYTITRASHADVAQYSCLVAESNGSAIVSNSVSISLVNCYYLQKTPSYPLSSHLASYEPEVVHPFRYDEAFCNFSQMIVL